MFNTQEFAAQLKGLGNAQLKQVAQQYQQDSLRFPLIGNEITERTRVQQAQQAAQAQPQPTVVQQVAQQAQQLPENTGIAQVAPNMTFADGGIVALAGGGALPSEIDELLERMKAADPYLNIEYVRNAVLTAPPDKQQELLTAFAKQQGESPILASANVPAPASAPAPAPAGGAAIPTNYPADYDAGQMGQPEPEAPTTFWKDLRDYFTKNRLLEAQEADARIAATPYVDPGETGGFPEVRTPEVRTATAPDRSQTYAQDIFNPKKPTSRYTTDDLFVQADKLRDNYREQIDNISKAAEARRTRVLADFDKETAELGIFGKEREARIAKRSAQLDKETEDAKGMALLQAGLAIMSADPRRGTWAAVGAGLGEGLKGYKADLAYIGKRRDAVLDAQDRLEELQYKLRSSRGAERRSLETEIAKTAEEKLRMQLQADQKIDAIRTDAIKANISAGDQLARVNAAYGSKLAEDPRFQALKLRYATVSKQLEKLNSSGVVLNDNEVARLKLEQNILFQQMQNYRVPSGKAPSPVGTTVRFMGEMP